jgi:predicted NAD/FAD-dependent oxidoreductase
VALASNSWADLNMEMPDTEVSAHMLQALRPLVGELDYDHIALHRWRYANIKRHFNSQGFFIDAENCLAACGDWCISGRIESAFRSACSLTGYIKNIF